MREGSTTDDYRYAVSGEGEFGTLGYEWSDKPHRLVYDLCGEVDALREKIARIRLEAKAIGDAGKARTLSDYKFSLSCGCEIQQNVGFLHVCPAHKYLVARERDACAAKAREFAEHYEQGSDGRNTFVLLAQWIEARSTLSK